MRCLKRKSSIAISSSGESMTCSRSPRMSDIENIQVEIIEQFTQRSPLAAVPSSEIPCTKLAKYYNKNNKLMVDLRSTRAHNSGVEIPMTDNIKLPRKLSEEQKPPPPRAAEPCGRHRKSRPLGQQPGASAAEMHRKKSRPEWLVLSKPAAMMAASPRPHHGRDGSQKSDRRTKSPRSRYFPSYKPCANRSPPAAPGASVSVEST